MATVTINDASLTAIAGVIREKLDVETTYLPSQMAAAIGSIPTGGTDLTSADAGKVVVESGGEYVLTAQTSRSISQNGTYDTTTNNQVVVSVSGGGGEGSPTFLSNSEASDILASEYYTSYDEDNNTWGDVDVYGTPTVTYSGIRTAANVGFDVQLGEPNRSVTAYAIVKHVEYVTDTILCMCSVYATQNGNGPNINYNRNSIHRSIWGSDISMGSFNQRKFDVIAMALDSSTNTAHYYYNGVSAGSAAYTNSGSSVSFNGASNHSMYAGLADYIYVGVVDGCEDSETILANQQEMLDFLSQARLL